MTSNRPSNTLTIIGLVLGLIALLISIVECVGTVAFIPGIVALIIGVIALLKAKDEGHPLGLSTAVIVVSLIACAISVYQIYNISSSMSKVKSEMKEYSNCDEVKADFERVEREMAELTKKMEDDQFNFGSIREMSKLGVQIEHIEEYSEELGCDIDFDDFDPSEIMEEIEEEGEGEAEEEVDEEGESESNEEEDK